MRVGNGCNPRQLDSWNDWQSMCPIDPLDLIAYASIGGTVGERYQSSNFLDPGAAWTANYSTISDAPKIVALETDNLQMVADADQWNFSHLTWNSSSALAMPLRKVIFLRGGVQWSNLIKIATGGPTIQDVQLSFMSNAGTRGDKQGTVPVIQWQGLGAANIDLALTLKKYGTFNLALWLYDGTNYTIMELYILSRP